MEKLGEATVTHRGFPMVEFLDCYGEKSELQCSSMIGEYDDAFERHGTSCVWLGVGDPKPQVLASEARSVGVETNKTTGWVEYPLPENVHLNARMHLNREQVKGLIDRLQEWLDTGAFA